MKIKFLLTGVLLWFCISGIAQFSVSFHIYDATAENIVAATITLQIDSANYTAISDSSGNVFFNQLPEGTYYYTVSHLLFYKKHGKLKLQSSIPDPIQIELTAKGEEEIEEVTIITNRSQQKLDNLPLQLEIVDHDELNERSLDKPADVSHAVKEQAGIQVQRTSANSGLFNIRLLGMKGKYVQLMKDNFPLFGGFSQNMILTQLSPLDLQHIEIIKGPNSTLYGGDAIAGVVNFVSKKPSFDNTERDILFNVESTKSLDLAANWNERFDKIGVRFTAQYRNQVAVDFNKDSFADIPKMSRVVMSPNVYYFINQNATLMGGAHFMYENRLGGTMAITQNRIDSNYRYKENNIATRYGYIAQFDYSFAEKGRLQIKTAGNIFFRKIALMDYQFSGRQIATQSEANYKWNKANNELIVGIDYKTDFFKAQKTDSVGDKLDYNMNTIGFFAQDMITVKKNTVLEGSIRLDYNFGNKFFALPHFSWLQKWNEIFSTKLNLGMGYKIPTIFQDETEEANFNNIKRIADTLKPERAYGGTLQFSIKSPSNKAFQITLNELFFFNHVSTPMIAMYRVLPDYTILSYRSSKGYIRSIGLETMLRAQYKGATIQINYTLQDQNIAENGKHTLLQYTSKHIFSFLAQYEMPNRFSIGTDIYYYSAPVIANGLKGIAICEFGINAQYIHKYVTFFCNLENILDQRQSKNQRIVTPSPDYNHPVFTTIYAPLEGRIFNIGCKIKFGILGKKKKDLD